MKRIIPLLLCLFLLSCTNSHDIEVVDIKSVDVIYFYAQHDPIEVNYNEVSPELVSFKEWLSNNRNDWKPYIATVAIGDFIVSGNSFSLHVGHGSAVLNYKSSGETKQLIKKVPENEFYFFRNP